MNTSPLSEHENVDKIQSQVDFRRELQEPGERIAISPSQELTLSSQPTQEGSIGGCRYPPGPILVAPADVARTERTARKDTRKRRPLPPQETRDWMTPTETALVLGCSVATVHRLRRGVIPGVEPLPCSGYGRKYVFRNASIARWQNDNEKRGPA
jgi:hypothetical protein